jgi:ribosomal protein L40E
MPRVKFPEAEKRLFTRVFICQQCGSKIRTDAIKVKMKKVKCRNCKSKELRAIHKEHKGV